MADLNRYASVGLLIIRVGLGASFIWHGLQKFLGGEENLKLVGSAVKNVGINGGFYAFGIAAATTESLGGLLLILGLFFRPACLMLTGVMAMATLTHYKAGDGFAGFSHAMEVGITFLGLALIGPGSYALGGKRKSKAAGEKKDKSKE